MGQIINGAELGSYRTVAIQLGQAKNANRNGVKSKYILLSLKDSYSMMSKTVRKVIFEEQLPGLHETLAKYAATTADASGNYPVNIPAFKASEDFAEWSELMQWPGGMVMQYKLRKGPCYANDIEGKRVLDRNNNPVIKDTISVFVQVRQIIPDGDSSRTVYVDGLSLDEEGQRMENRFYMEAANESDVDPLAAVMPPVQAQTAPEAPVSVIAPEASARPF